MKPPTTEALRYAATVLGRELTQLEKLQASIDGPAARGQLDELLAQVRSVRTWILGVQMPIAQCRAPLSERIDARKRMLARIKKAAASPLGIVAAHVKDVPRYACSESWDCRCPECMTANAGNPREREDLKFYCSPICIGKDEQHARSSCFPDTCDECGAALAHVVGPNVNGVVCPHCHPDSALLDDDPDHEIDCRCPECGEAPIQPEDLKLLRTAVVGLIPPVSPARAQLKEISRDLRDIFGPVRKPCAHPNARPALDVPALSCPDCGSVFRKIEK
jgi:hypothetical protein